MTKQKAGTKTIKVSESTAEMLYQELKLLRLWFQGRESAGGANPPGVQALWQVQSLLRHGKL